MKYLISGGGTGGHIYPALSIAKEIKRNDKNSKFLYVGTKDGLESKLVAREGIDFRPIRVKGMPRRLNKNSLIAFKELLIGFRQSAKILKEFKPDIVIGTGGYVCGPIVFQAKRRRIPSLIHEQNAYPGITNKILSRYVDKVATTFEESIKYFKHPERVIVTGNPIRREILQINKVDAYEKLGISRNSPFILSFGGSGGQKALNNAILEIIRNDLIQKDYQLIHITGHRFYESFIKDLEGLKIKANNIRIFPYFYEMPEAINIADLIITSSGAITLAELSAIGKPSILIPKAYTAENHQEYNAKAFEKSGASIVVLEKDLSGNYLANKINELTGNKDLLNSMSQKSKRLGKIDAVDKIYEIILELLA